ncbi:MAG: peptidylprolyl isomerase [Deltaproteobacteria bacterium]|nr:MAG: peptidylprolyl isomerase [Deltaproteobacteria bacterium]
MKIKLSALFLAAFAVASIAGCKRDGKHGPVIAKVGNDSITAEEFKKRLDETSPFLRARYNTIERKKEFLESLIRNELLAQEAERQGLDKSPAVREQVKRAMIQELIKKQLDEKLSGNDIPDSELKGYYDSHIDDFVKPERARVYHILVAAKDAKDKAQAKKKAEALLKDINERTRKGEVNAFQAVAQKDSQDPTSAPMGGDLRFVSKDELTKSYSAELANAAFDLKNPGDVAGPIETPAGAELVKLQVKTPTVNRSFEESKEGIRGRMARERRSKDYDDFVKKLRDNGNVSIDEGELAKVVPSEPASPSMSVVPRGMPSAAPASVKIGGK